MNKYLKMEFNEENFKEEIKNEIEKEINKAKEQLERGPDTQPVVVNVGLNAMHFLDAVFDKEEVKQGNVIEMIKDTQNTYAGKRFLVTEVCNRGIIAIRASKKDDVQKIIINAYDVKQGYREFEVIRETL